MTRARDAVELTVELTVAAAPAGGDEEGAKAAPPSARPAPATRPRGPPSPPPLFPPPLGPPARHACMDPAACHEPHRRGTVELRDGARLAWWTFLPAGPPAARLLVVWGAFATSRHFDDVAACLAARGVEVLLYHHRGVALSGPCLGHQSAELLARDALALVDAELAVMLAGQGRLASLALSVCSRGGLLPPRAAALLPLLRAALHSRAATWLLRAWYGAHRSEAALVFTPAFLVSRHPESGEPMRAHYARWWCARFNDLFSFADARTIAAHTAVIATHWLDSSKARALRDSGAPILVQVSQRDLLIPPAAQRALGRALSARVVSFDIGHMGIGFGSVAAEFTASLLENVGVGAVLARVRGAAAAAAAALMP
ncbi:hypothetical protein Rsub_08209 [Raphidocelis subcapitata]|uniref:Serine aminopeptidase S33 domain-containing protein n=1 Tax=Raphidocelis subcapitata TaxID=307507 RepID=A0A2V0PCZ0_9CHLO|nr:hypothetical protein Rsub_08209 [Raphidocelis subcapitata]|eukprot:GBF95773.1 hypothetical protein Rsub_08209 [Raphidocelis subcapitata]